MFRIEDRVRVGIVFRVRVWFCLSTHWRVTGGNIAIHSQGMV